MTSPTTPDAITRWQVSDPASLVQMSTAIGDSVQTALNKRERYDFVWANTTERNNQTTMVQGSRGYQIDSKAEYIYDNANWRLAASYYEANSTTNPISTANSGTINVLTANSNSTDTAFISSGTGLVTVENAGIYSFHLAGKENGSNPCGGQSQLVISSSNTFADVAGRLANGMFAGALMATAVLPFYRTTVADEIIYFYFYNDAGATRTINCTLSIGRVA